MVKRPNFYAILELDPSINDWQTIESTIQRKRREWCMLKLQGTQAQRSKAERFLTYIPEMECLFKDSKACEQEQKTYQQEIKKNKQTQLEQLDKLIKNSQASRASEKLISTLMKQTENVFTKKEIEDRLRQYGIERKEHKDKKEVRPVLEASVTKGIRNELDILELRSLYDFLNLDEFPKLNVRSSAKSLYERADTIYKELNRIGKTDADSSLRMNLAGRAKSVFCSDSVKKRYDNTLASEKLNELDKHLEVAGYNGFLENNAVLSLLTEGKKLGISESIVMEYIEDYAVKRNWGVQQEAGLTKIKLQTCGYCDTLAATPQDKNCNNCGEELALLCPRCGTLTPTENYACSKCGFHTGDAPLVKSILQNGKKLINEGDYDKAISYLNRALEYWSDWSPAIEEKKRAESKRKESYEALSEIKSLIKLRKLESADLKLDQYEYKFGQMNTAKVSEQISKGLSIAEMIFTSAEKLYKAGKTELALDKYEESLSHCVDYSPALSAMAASPPSAPTNISSKWLGDTLRLSWPDVKISGKLSYIVLRKTNGAPSNRSDGDVIAETTITQVDDSNVRPGAVYYYSVFSVRGSVVSEASAMSGPHLLVAEVNHIDYHAGNRQVSINWQPPFGCSQIEVWRRDGATPSRKGEGVKMVVSGNSILDTGLENDRRYGYLIVANYRHPEDSSRTLYSKGVEILATPVAPPEPVSDLKIQRTDHTVILSWTPVSGKAKVQIRQTQSIPKMTPGQIISLSNVAQYGTLVPNTTNENAQTILKVQGRVYFVPLSVISETVVLGKPVSISILDDVSNLEAKRYGGSIILTWRWPQGTTEALVVYHYNHFSRSPNDNDTIKTRITRTEYEHRNFCELRSVERKKHYFTVYIKDPLANIYSSGANVLVAMNQEMTVRYQVITHKSLFTRKTNSAWVEFKGEPGVSLEGLLIVLKQKYPPVSKDDGVIVATVDRLTFMEGISKIEIPKVHLNSQGYIKVFFNNDDDAKEIRLLPLRQEKLKLN